MNGDHVLVTVVCVALQSSHKEMSELSCSQPELAALRLTSCHPLPRGYYYSEIFLHMTGFTCPELQNKTKKERKGEAYVLVYSQAFTQLLLCARVCAAVAI